MIISLDKMRKNAEYGFERMCNIENNLPKFKLSNIHHRPLISAPYCPRDSPQGPLAQQRVSVAQQVQSQFQFQSQLQFQLQCLVVAPPVAQPNVQQIS
jgi:hypothetical protein